ncbi:BLUF domain-containing protein [Gilvimarinus sp. 1_MG-2023]|uniref:BLUF domain-containing protein n=1 Tax=Gilvimarinus sp. 1_MG-2023 TaxID=3062638 RepID=UPI0026E43E05|nr:BLUF domain-containing protein [Gilvimarinus sp. 1_MG-2023]MDO6747007.1 BLUF domain-containing protein [Gilvimarinus sp. 1_MG-2023]
MKRIACLCTITEPEDHTSHSENVFYIFDSARKFNKEQNIVGTFLVLNNVLLQILEGEPSGLANVVYRVNRDPRISNVAVILNTAIETPSFTRWSIKLLSEQCAAHRTYLQKIHSLINEKSLLKTNEDRIRYNKIFQSILSENIKQNQTPEEDSYTSTSFNNTLLGMSSWPRPTQLRVNAGLMKICPLLIGHTIEYKKLLELELFNSAQELNSYLQQLREAKALTIIQTQDPSNLHSFEAHQNKNQQTPRPGRFSQALKNFISGQGMRASKP